MRVSIERYYKVKPKIPLIQKNEVLGWLRTKLHTKFEAASLQTMIKLEAPSLLTKYKTCFKWLVFSPIRYFEQGDLEQRWSWISYPLNQTDVLHRLITNRTEIFSRTSSNLWAFIQLEFINQVIFYSSPISNRYIFQPGWAQEPLRRFFSSYTSRT